MRLPTTAAAAIAALAATANAFDLQQLQQPLQSILKSQENKQHQKQQPNIVFILTDDQDLQLDSLSYMPLLQKHLQREGTFYENHFVPTALCCPARVTLWTGRYAHNTNVTNVKPPYGGYPKFVEQGFNSNFLPIWLQSAGYNTYYTGKLFNSHTVENYHSPHVAGFNGSDFLLDPFTYSYLNSVYQRNHHEPTSYAGRHTTDVITEKALGLLDDGIAGVESAGRPFFVGIAPVAPHANMNPSDPPLKMTEPIPAERHKHLFKGVKVPRKPHFNPDTPSGVNWIASLPQQDEATVDQNDHFYRQRLRALQGVDELVDQVVTRLDDAGVLDNTYIIYTSDNGYHIGQHRLPPGKECGFDEDIRVPLFIRGPGIPKGRVEKAVTAHVDLAPTVLHLAGAAQRDDFDGIPVPLPNGRKQVYNREIIESHKRHEHANVEFWGIAIPEGEGNSFGPNNPAVVENNTYKGLRLHSPESGYDLYYSVWCNNAHELYDLTKDPYQLHNIYPSSSSIHRYLLGASIDQVINRLDALLLVLKSCRGHTCHAPWSVLHPKGDVETLKDALDSKFDYFYEEQVKIEYDRCEGGYIVDAEGPQVGYQYLTERDGLGWSHWE
ncbi:putative arylsulfatase [Talaromyces proteolyticus]|uniref:Arylsulfatase n=1 Tax=Talaromyces proteolyticus TaxID=1131652 RepID=A0AAD4PVC8_9EURO|nr:putative arylsulfatase [Talaromyces proteolyticus]KAH8690578.1 putative arylsulfatase [Talaromyces proteolyticus]